MKYPEFLEMIRKQKGSLKTLKNARNLAKIMLLVLGIFFLAPTLSAMAADYSFVKSNTKTSQSNTLTENVTKIPLVFNGKILENAVSVEVFTDNCSLKTESVVLFSELTPTLQEASAFGLTGNFVQNTFRFNPRLSSDCAALNVVDSADQINSIVAVSQPVTEFVFRTNTEPKISAPILTQNGNPLPVLVNLSTYSNGNEFTSETKTHLNSKVAANSFGDDCSENNFTSTNFFKVLRC